MRGFVAFGLIIITIVLFFAYAIKSSLPVYDKGLVSSDTFKNPHNNTVQSKLDPIGDDIYLVEINGHEHIVFSRFPLYGKDPVVSGDFKKTQKDTVKIEVDPIGNNIYLVEINGHEHIAFKNLKTVHIKNCKSCNTKNKQESKIIYRTTYRNK